MIVGGFASVRTVQVLLLGKQDDGRYLVSTGQYVSPVGRVEKTEYARPKDLALSPDEKYVAAMATAKVFIYSRSGDLEKALAVKTGALGVAWSKQGKLYVSGGDGSVSEVVKSTEGWTVSRNFKVDTPELINAEKPSNPQVLGLAVSKDSAYLYAALGIRNAVVKIDLASEKPVASCKTDVAPYRVLLSPDETKLFVANRGGAAPGKSEARANSAGTDVAVDAGTDAALRGSISVVDLSLMTAKRVEVGRQPSGMVCRPDGSVLYVADSDSDTVSIVDAVAAKRIGVIPVTTADDPEFGRIPTDLALSPDTKQLFVSCGGINALAVIALETKPEVVGYVPTGWFPISVKADDNGLVVASSKGIGSRPSNKTTKFGVHDSVGTVQFATYSDIAGLDSLSKAVAINNGWEKVLEARKDVAPVPIPVRLGEPSVFKHVIYIIKENLTYDLMYGDMPEGNGDKGICIFGEDVTPNQHRLARDFVLLDNFYTSGTNSADGHQWTSSSICNAYQEQNYSANQRSYPYDGGDPLAYSPKGYLWTAAAKAGISVRVYGEFVNKPSIKHKKTGKSADFFTLWDDYKNGKNEYEIRAITDNKSLRKYLHPNYIGFPMVVSDQWRADLFLKEFDEYVKKDNLPRLCMLLLPNNHTSGTSTFFPTPRAMVADNDLALGRIVDAVSRSKYWKDTLIVVVEDDSQSGVDHLDGHRTAALCISAYSRKGQTVSEFFNHSSMIRSIELVLGIPPMNRFDASANSMASCFNSVPNYLPFQFSPNNIPLDERNPVKTALNPEARKLAEQSEQQDWTNYDKADPTVVARAMWQSQRPNKPFPWTKFNPPSPGEDDDE